MAFSTQWINTKQYATENVAALLNLQVGSKPHEEATHVGMLLCLVKETSVSCQPLALTPLHQVASGLQAVVPLLQPHGSPGAGSSARWPIRRLSG